MLSVKKVAEIFGGSHLKQPIETLVNNNEISQPVKFRSGAIFRKGWPVSDIHQIGSRLGFIQKPVGPKAISVFTTKGGVLKTFLALNIARTAAIHGLKTCVVGLDMQGDVTNALGFQDRLEHSEDLSEMISQLNKTKGLFDLFNQQVRLDELLVETDLPSLFLIPETPELVAFNESLTNINRREYWLKEKVVEPLKKHFDLVVMDCSPNWNKITTNALVASDALVSPLECKINNFRNFKVFRHFMDEFKSEMQMKFESIYIPTRYSAGRKLSMEIKSWYEANVHGCLNLGIRESVLGEESTALKKSLIEHAPNHAVSKELRELMRDVFSLISRNKNLESFQQSATI